MKSHIKTNLEYLKLLTSVTLPMDVNLSIRRKMTICDIKNILPSLLDL
jgi:hypothetical protein